MIQWKSVAENPARFERVMKMLIRRLYPTAQGMDGSGGDGGVDVWLQTDAGPVIFEVKSFAWRLTPPQRRQIEKSLATASQHNPVAWHLVLPLEHSPAEKKWFDQLRLEYPTILLSWRGTDWLDEQFALHDDLRIYMEGPERGLLALSAEMHLEQAAFTRGVPDLAERLSTLHARAQDISPFYRVDFATDGTRQQIVRTLDASAGQISIKARLQVDPDDHEATRASRELSKVLAYGGETRIRGGFIEALSIFDADHLVEELGPFGSDSQLRLATPQDTSRPPVPCRLRVLGDDGSGLASLDLSLRSHATGHAGISARGSDLSGMVDLTLRVDHERDGVPLSGGLELNLASPHRQWPSAIRPVADLLLAAHARNLVEVELAGKPVARGHMDACLPAPILAVANLVVVLDDLRQLTDVHVPIPDEVSPAATAMLTALRDLHRDGKAVAPPGHARADAHRPGPDQPVGED